MNEVHSRIERAATLAERSEATAARIAVLKPYRWPKGVSGNPLGKSGLLAVRIRHETQQGKELRDILLGIARDAKESTRHRLRAVEMLLERGWGKPLAAVAVQHLGDKPRDDRALKQVLGAMTDEELDWLSDAMKRTKALLAQAAERAESRAATPSDNGVPPKSVRTMPTVAPDGKGTQQESAAWSRFVDESRKG